MRSAVLHSHLVWAFAIFAAGRSFVLTVLGYSYLTPDTFLYAQGGLGLFPSPLGRLVGAAGYDVLAAVNIIASGALVLAVAYLAAQVGGNPTLAAALAAITPLGIWTMFAGVDTLGALLLVIAAIYHLQGRTKVSLSLGLAASLTHLAVLPIFAVTTIAILGVRRAIPCLVACTAVAAFVLLLTPYGGNVAALSAPAVLLGAGALTLGVATLPFLPWLGRLTWPTPLRPWLIGAAIGTVLAAGLIAASGDGLVTKCRYALPITMLAAAGVTVRSANLHLRSAT